jgi:hypothetical protein
MGLTQSIGANANVDLLNTDLCVHECFPEEPLGERPTESDERLLRLDDRFHETGIDEAMIDGTGSMLVDSSFGKC